MNQKVRVQDLNDDGSRQIGKGHVLEDNNIVQTFSLIAKVS